MQPFIGRYAAVTVGLCAVTLACVSLTGSGPGAFDRLAPGYYVRWNNDHTVRDIRPSYRIDEAQLGEHRAYRIELDGQRRAAEVTYFHYGQPSERSDFGAHRLQFRYGETEIDRIYFGVDGNRRPNQLGVFTERYVLGAASYPTKKVNLDADGRPMEDSYGAAEYIFVRDARGRRVSERRINLAGDIVPEHNGFKEARFAFDANDFAKYRKGYSKDGVPENGPGGYHAAHFWFDAHGAFIKEEFRDVDGNLGAISTRRLRPYRVRKPRRLRSVGSHHDVWGSMVSPLQPRLRSPWRHMTTGIAAFPSSSLITRVPRPKMLRASRGSNMSMTTTRGIW